MTSGGQISGSAGQALRMGGVVISVGDDGENWTIKVKMTAFRKGGVQTGFLRTSQMVASALDIDTSYVVHLGLQ